MPVTQRSQFVREVYSKFDGSYEIQKALTSKYYAPHFLLMLTERDTFMKMTDFSLYNAALSNTSIQELDEISKTNNYDEQFLRFLRYVTMLDQKDPKQVEGQKFVEMVYGLDKFQGYKNQSLHILENESIVHEEEGLEEGAHRVHAHSLPPHQQRLQIKNIRIDDFYQHLLGENEKEAIDFLKSFNISDLLYFRGPQHLSMNITILQENQTDFYSSYVSQQNMTLL